MQETTAFNFTASKKNNFETLLPKHVGGLYIFSKSIYIKYNPLTLKFLSTSFAKIVWD